MTLATERERNGARPAWIVEIDLDYVTSSTAVEDSDGKPCYNTPSTSGGFAPLTVGTLTRRYVSRTAPQWAGLNALACVESVRIEDEKITLGRTLSQFGKATITFRDFEDDDRGEDPFYSTRTPTPGSAPYFQRLIKRNPYVQGREVRIWLGYLTDGYEEANGEWHTYYARGWSRTASGQVTLDAVGPLRLIGLKDSVAPEPTGWKLDAAITETDTTATLALGSYDDATDPTSGTLRLGDELATFTRSGATLTLVRGVQGTTAEAADEGDKLQICIVYTATRVEAILEDLLTTYGGVDASLIPTADWTAEADTWLSTYIIDETLSEPEKIIDYCNELAKQCGLALYWSPPDNEIKLLALRPPVGDTITDLTDDDILAPLQRKQDLGRRISRTDVLFDKRSPVADVDKQASYKKRILGLSLGAGEFEHNGEALEEILSRWFAEDDEELGARTAYTNSAQFRDGLVEYTVQVSKRHEAIRVGDVVRLTSKDITDDTGETPEPTLCRVTARRILRPGHSYSLICTPTIYNARYFVLSENDAPTTYGAATTEERDPAAYLAETDGTMPNGDIGYALA